MSLINVRNISCRVVEPIHGWQSIQEKSWGDDSFFVEEWFDEGDAIEFNKHDWEFPIEEPEGWERALQWVRSLAVVTGLRPA